ncbi:hydroxymethylpyrimidine/phosphomethylpyrimidine kinase, partial [Flavobacterium sp. IR1]
THGTGCTYAAAIAAELAKGRSIKDSVQTAKLFITEAIRHSLSIGEGIGPTNHHAYKNSLL